MSHDTDDISSSASAVASPDAGGLPDPQTSPPDLRVVHFWGCVFFAAGFFAPLVRVEGNYLWAREIPWALAFLGHPSLCLLGRWLFAIQGLGLLAALVTLKVRVDAWQIKMTFLAAAGLSPFAAMFVALRLHVGFFPLWNMLNLGAWMTIAAAIFLLFLAGVEFACRHEPKAQMRPWLAVARPEYVVGTLAYTRKGLLLMCAWLLWGDLVWKIMEMVFGPAIQWQLDRMEIPKQWNSLLIQTFPAVVSFIMVPIISFRSDRTRTRLGRRIPYILATIVPLTFFVCVLGFSENIAGWIQHSAWALGLVHSTRNFPRFLRITPKGLVISYMAVLIACYDFSNVFVNSVFWYLFRDVIPRKFMARYMAAFAIVGGVAGLIWNQFFFLKIFDSHSVHYVYTTVGLVYFFGFGLMCFMVKEGQYPAVTDVAKGEPWLRRTGQAVVTYFRECFWSHPIYRMFFISDALMTLSGACSGGYFLLLQVKGYGFSAVDLKNLGIALIPTGMLLNVLAGWIADRIHPIYAWLLASTAGLPFFFILFSLHQWQIGSLVLSTFTLWAMIQFMRQPLGSLGGIAGGVPLLVRLYPAKQYGQFCSAASMFRNLLMIGGTIIGGFFVKAMLHKHGDAGYRYIFLWQGVFCVLGCCCQWIVFFIWRANGGDNFKFDPEVHAAQAKRFDVVQPKS